MWMRHSDVFGLGMVRAIEGRLPGVFEKDSVVCFCCCVVR